MLLSTLGLTAWIIANVIAAAAFLHFASWSWLEPNLRGEDVARAGDAIVWGLTAFPILVLAALADLAWLLFAARERRGRNAPWPFSSLLIVGAVWLSALVVDSLRGRGF